MAVAASGPIRAGPLFAAAVVVRRPVGPALGVEVQVQPCKQGRVWDEGLQPQHRAGIDVYGWVGLWVGGSVGANMRHSQLPFECTFQGE